MNTSWINLDALWKIVVFGVLLGAGLPALFAIGLRAMSPSTPATVPVETGSTTGGGAQPQPGDVVGRAIAVLCFAIVLAAIGWGIYSIVHQS